METPLRRILAAPERALDRVATHPPLAVALILLLCALLYLPGLASLPVTDRDEARFATASRQMAETGDIVDIRFQEAPRHKKPVGIYWLQAASARLAGAGPTGPIWPYRLPATLGALLAVLLTFGMGRRFQGPGTGLTAALVLASALVLAGEARLARADAVLLATVVGAQAALALLWRGGAPRAAPYALWACLGLSVLVKGPIGPIIVGLTALALVLAERRAGWLRPAAPGRALLLFAAIVLPWYAAITWRTGAEFWQEALVRDLLSKAQEGQEGHGAPPGSYLLGLPLIFWPGAALLLPLLPALYRRRRDPGIRFALAWLLPGWLLFEAIPTKLLHYPLPLFPALALLAGLGWDQRALPPALPARLLSLVLAAIGPVLLGAAMIFSLRHGGGFPAAGLATLLLAASGLVVFWRVLATGQRRTPPVVLALLAAVTFAGIFHTLARTEWLWPTGALARAAAGLGCAPVSLAAAGYEEPSLVFAFGRDTRLTDAEGAAAFLAVPGCRLAVLADTGRAAFLSALPTPPVALARIEGFALGAGRPVDLTLYRAGPPR